MISKALILKILQENQNLYIANILDDVICRYEDIINTCDVFYEHIIHVEDPSVYIVDDYLMTRLTIRQNYVNTNYVKSDVIMKSYRVDLQYMNKYEAFIYMKDGCSIDVILDYIKILNKDYDIVHTQLPLYDAFVTKIVISY